MCPGLERPNIWVILAAVNCSGPDTNVAEAQEKSALSCSPLLAPHAQGAHAGGAAAARARLPRARRGAIACSWQSVVARWEPCGARRETEGKALPSTAPHAMWTSWCGGLTHEARAAGGKGPHGTSFPLWDCSPVCPVGSMENASAYQHSMPIRPSSSFKFP